MRYESNFIILHVVIPASFAEKTILSPLNFHGILVKNHVTLTVRVFFWTPNCTPLTSVSIPMPVPHCLDYYSFIVGFEIGKCESSKSVLFQHCFDYSTSLPFVFTIQFTKLEREKGRVGQYSDGK